MPPSTQPPTHHHQPTLPRRHVPTPAVIPYYGYARADRKVLGRESIAAKLTANLLTEAGADRVLAMDLHSGQCVGYFDIPVDHVYGEGPLGPGREELLRTSHGSACVCSCACDL
jgi:phosphoribosylpyrophosphate synthetase